MRRPGPWILAVATLVAAPNASAASRLDPVPVAAVDLADATNAVAPALRGHVVFSRLVAATGRYELVEWTARSGPRVLPVGDRAVAFDADLGREPHGRILLTWSRCTNDGVDSYPNPSFDFSQARGCRLWSLRLDVPAAVPHRLRLRGDARLSLTTPSVHYGSVVAVAAPRRGSRNVRILL